MCTLICNHFGIIDEFHGLGYMGNNQKYQGDPYIWGFHILVRPKQDCVTQNALYFLLDMKQRRVFHKSDNYITKWHNMLYVMYNPGAMQISGMNSTLIKVFA